MINLSDAKVGSEWETVDGRWCVLTEHVDPPTGHNFVRFETSEFSFVTELDGKYLPGHESKNDIARPWDMTNQDKAEISRLNAALRDCRRSCKARGESVSRLWEAIQGIKKAAEDAGKPENGTGTR